MNQVSPENQQPNRHKNRTPLFTNLVTVLKFCVIKFHQDLDPEVPLQPHFLQFLSTKLPSKNLLLLQTQKEHLLFPAEPPFVVHLNICLKFRRKDNLQRKLVTFLDLSSFSKDMSVPRDLLSPTLFNESPTSNPPESSDHSTSPRAFV